MRQSPEVERNPVERLLIPVERLLIQLEAIEKALRLLLLAFTKHNRALELEKEAEVKRITKGE